MVMIGDFLARTYRSFYQYEGTQRDAQSLEEER